MVPGGTTTPVKPVVFGSYNVGEGEPLKEERDGAQPRTPSMSEILLGQGSTDVMNLWPSYDWTYKGKKK